MTGPDAFILIGGRSSRFGSDKAFAQLDDESLAARAGHTVERAFVGSKITFVSAASDQFDSSMLFGLGHPVIADLKPGFGVWSALHAALAYAQTDWIVLLACDFPYVSTGALTLLARTSSDKLDAVMFRQQDGRLQPLCAFYRTRKVMPIVESMLDAPRTLPPLGKLAELVKTRIVEAAEYRSLNGSDRFFHNINSPRDLVNG
jgi:molybdenum cofactor guanylyltransferase